MDAIFLSLQSIIFALGGVGLVVIHYLWRQCCKSQRECQEIVNSVKHAYNTQSDTVEKLILKVQDVETALAMERKRRS